MVLYVMKSMHTPVWNVRVEPADVLVSLNSVTPALPLERFVKIFTELLQTK